MKASVLISLFLIAFLARTDAAGQSTRELIADPTFRRGFILWETKPGKHIRYGELKGFVENETPVWGLSQWSSHFPLVPSTAIRGHDVLICSNAAKAILCDRLGVFSMAVNTAAEYGSKARSAKAPWVHLLVEQEFDAPPHLSEVSAARLHVEARLIRSTNLHQGDFSADRHAAQFQIFFTVQNRNRGSKGFGDLLWFGVPIYDSRDRFPKAFKAQDFGGTARFIFSPAGETFSGKSAHDGEWLVIEKDLLPLMREALDTAWARGFLSGSKDVTDYAIGGMNMGWELPGTFDVEMQVRGLSLRVVRPPQ